MSHILLAPAFAGSIWKWADGEDSFAKLLKDRLWLLSHIPFTSSRNTREHNSFDIDENGYGEADHDEQLNTYPLGGV